MSRPDDADGIAFWESLARMDTAELRRFLAFVQAKAPPEVAP